MKEIKNIYMVDSNVAKAAYRSGQVDYRNNIMDLTEFEDLLATNPDSVIQGPCPQLELRQHLGLQPKEPASE